MEMTGDITSDAFPAFCREHGLKCTAQRQVCKTKTLISGGGRDVRRVAQTAL